MGLRMYRTAPSPPSLALKVDPTAGARSPIRRNEHPAHSPRRRGSSSRNGRPRSSPVSSSAASHSSPHEPYSVPGSYTPRPQDDTPAPILSNLRHEPVGLLPDTPAEDLPGLAARAEALGRALPHIFFGSEPELTSTLPAAASGDATRRMQVTPQFLTQPADREPTAAIRRFVVRPILSDGERSTLQSHRRRTSTVNPRELLVRSEERPRSSDAHRTPIHPSTRRQHRTRSRSPSRTGAAPRLAPLDHTDGLGDRRRSPSMDESDWETLRATIPPDAQLPSASSSFTSSSASSSSLGESATGSAASSATTRTSATPNHRYVVPTPANLDITIAQLECGVVCDDARDARPPFPSSRGPSRPTTREPSARPAGRRSPSLPGSQLPDLGIALPGLIDAPPAMFGFFVRAATAATAADDVDNEAAAAQPDNDSTAPTRLRSPSPPSQGGPPPPTQLSTRMAEVRHQWQQLHRINQLLICGQEVPSWLWEVAGLPPELQTREFEI